LRLSSLAQKLSSLPFIHRDGVVLMRITERTRGTNWEELANSCTTADKFTQTLGT
jgi:hypothetical protein